MRSHEVEYEILGDDLQLVEVELDPGEAVIAEAGGMTYIDKLFGAGKRMLVGESLFMTHFKNEGQTKQRVAFAAPYPGKILALNLAELGEELFCQKDAFLAAALGTQLSIAFTKRMGAGLFGGEGFILQKLVGDGMVFVHAGD